VGAVAAEWAGRDTAPADPGRDLVWAAVAWVEVEVPEAEELEQEQEREREQERALAELAEEEAPARAVDCGKAGAADLEVVEGRAVEDRVAVARAADLAGVRAQEPEAAEDLAVVLVERVEDQEPAPELMGAERAVPVAGMAAGVLVEEREVAEDLVVAGQEGLEVPGVEVLEAAAPAQVEEQVAEAAGLGHRENG
jgi:hypothetical protein